MGVEKQGVVEVTIPDDITIPPEAGTLSWDELKRKEKPRRTVGVTCMVTAAAMAKNPDKLVVPGVTAEALQKAGRMADGMDTMIEDLEVLLNRFKQGNVLLDAAAHRLLRKVLAVVRSQEKFDASIPGLVPQLIEYFANARTQEKESE